MKIDLHTAMKHAQAGRLQLETCGEVLQRKFARDFAASVVACFREFRSRDNRLQLALDSVCDWLRGRLNRQGLQAAFQTLRVVQRDAFRTNGAMAAVMRVVEVFEPSRYAFRRFYKRVAAAKAIRATAESLAPLQTLSAYRTADEARQATCVYAFYKRPQLAVRHHRRSHEIVPAAFQAIREYEIQKQCRHVVQTLRWMTNPIANELLQSHENGDLAARAIFWDWCEEQGFNLCPSFHDVFDPASLKRLEQL